MPKPYGVPDRADPGADATPNRRSMNGAAVETVTPRKRRGFTAAEKLRIVKAAESALASGERGALEALLRKEGIYSSHLATWRRQLAADGAEGLASRKAGRKPKLDAKERQLLDAQQKVTVLERKLKIANAIIELQKKAHEVLGIALPDPEDAI